MEREKQVEQNGVKIISIAPLDPEIFAFYCWHCHQCPLCIWGNRKGPDFVFPHKRGFMDAYSSNWLPNIWWRCCVIVGDYIEKEPTYFHHISATNFFALLLVHVNNVYTNPSAIFPSSKYAYLDMFSSWLSKSGNFLFYMKQCDSGYVVI